MFGDVVVQLRERSGGFDARSASDDELFAAAVALSEVESSAAAARVEVLAELEARGSCDREHGLPTAPWLASVAAMPKSVARRHVDVAKKLRLLPEVGEALADGRIGMHHAEVLARVWNPRIADALVEVQPRLLDLIEGATFERWRDDVRDLARAIDADGGYDPAQDQATNELHVTRTLDGITYVRGRFVGDEAEIVRHALATATDEVFRRCRADAERTPDLPVPEPKQLRALAHVELYRRGLATDVSSTRAPRPEAILIVHADEPRARPTEPTLPLRPRDVRLQDGTLRTLRCDADWYPVVVDSLGEPLDLGRRTRLATPGQRRALTVRDGGCAFPGCDRPMSWCDVHHVEHVAHGGRSDLRNLVALCRYHHGLSHRAGWAMQATGDGWFTWTTPSGQLLWSQRHQRRRVQRQLPGRAPPAAA